MTNAVANSGKANSPSPNNADGAHAARLKRLLDWENTPHAEYVSALSDLANPDSELSKFVDRADQNFKEGLESEQKRQWSIRAVLADTIYERSCRKSLGHYVEVMNFIDKLAEDRQITEAQKNAIYAAASNSGNKHFSNHLYIMATARAVEKLAELCPGMEKEVPRAKDVFRLM